MTREGTGGQRAALPEVAAVLDRGSGDAIMCEREEREKRRRLVNEERFTLGPEEESRVNGPHGNCCRGLNFDWNSKCGTIARLTRHCRSS